MANDLVVLKLDRCTIMLRECRTLQDANKIAGLAEAARVYSKRVGAGVELTNEATMIRVKAERRFGEIMARMPKAKPPGIGGKKPPILSSPPSLASLGVGKDTAKRCRKLAKVPENKIEEAAHDAVAAGKEISPGQLIKAVVGEEKKEKAEKRGDATDKAARGIVNAKFEDVCDIRCCSFEKLLSDCHADVIITDPPYPREFIPLYGRFARAAKASGIPIVAVMCGQTYFPMILADMCEHLEYRWLLCYLTPGGTLQQWSEKALCGWKPVVLFGGDRWVHDVFRSDKEDKRFHEWGQSISGLSDLVDRLSEPGQTVCDPFCGGGSTAIASLLLGRRFIGCDIDEEAVKTATKRAKEICNGD